jgi:predicted flap endonuclease-1-like 5' DNA nuclease
MNEDANGAPVADLTMPAEDSLNGVPNVGPARRAALEAAGVTTRAQLARATVDQLVGMTGMARSLAERTLEFVRQNAVVAAATNVEGDCGAGARRRRRR